MKNLAIKNKAHYIILVILIKIMYIYLNVLMLPEEWASFDFDRNIQISNLIWEIPIFCILLITYLKYLRPGHPISFAITVLFCIYFIPSNSCLVLSDYNILYYLSINIFNILLIIFLGKASFNIKLQNIESKYDEIDFQKNKNLNRILRYLTIFTCFGVIAYVYFIGGGIDLSQIFNEDIYGRRAALADLYLMHTDGLIAYIMVFWTAFYSTMLIVGLYISIQNKRYLDVILCLFAYLVLFSFDSQKSILLKPVIAFYIFFLYKRDKLYKVEYVFLIGYFFLCCFSLLEYVSNNESSIYTIVIRRITYMPQYLSHAYYDFFEAHDKLWLTRDFFQLEKIVRLFISSPYQHGAVTIIRDNCFPGIPSPNTGLFAEAFAQLGYIGVFLMPVVYAYLIRIYYKYSIVFGKGGSNVLLASLALSLTNIQLLAPRGILIVLIFMLVSIWIRRTSKI